MKRFVVVGIRRTGTTLIRTTLDQHQDVRCHGELFTFGGRFIGARGDKNEFGYRRYLQESFWRRFRDVINRRRLVEEYLDQVFAVDDHKVVGFKLMISQHEIFPSVMPYLKHHEAKVIHVVRENVLKTLVSRAAKKVTGESHTRTPGGKTIVTLREHRLLSDLEGYERENRFWEQTAAGMPYLRVGYEDFVQDKQLELSRMLDFLEVEHVPGLESPLAKGNSDELREIISNYDEVANVLKGTRFEWCLTR